jgi:type II secretory pathway component PulC
VFGNLVFEITRVGYFTDVRSRTVTITVPGNPPESALFRVGDTFASGRIRVVEILPSAVILEYAGKQQAFGLLGAEPDQSPIVAPMAGPTFMAPTSTSVIPDLKPGQMQPARDPRLEAEPAKEGQPKLESYDQLPEYYAVVERAEFSELLRMLPEYVRTHMVLAPARERESRVYIGVEVKNLKPECPLALHGLRTGDVIMYFNGEDIRGVSDLDLAVTQAKAAEELVIEFRRDGQQMVLIIHPGVPEETKPAETAPRRG